MPDKTPPGPREPAAREAVEGEAMKFIIERGWEDDNYGVARVAAAFALAYSAELRAALTTAINGKQEALTLAADQVKEAAKQGFLLRRVGPDAFEWKNSRAEAAERSLLQARAEMKTRLERALADAKDINEYAKVCKLESLLKVLGHTTGMIIRLERELASTSAPEGEAAK